MSDMLKAKYGDRTFEIPGIWLAGFMSSHPGITIPEVLAWWAQQEEWAELERQQRDA